MLTGNLTTRFLVPLCALTVLLACILSAFFILHEVGIMKTERINYATSLARNLAYNSEYGVLTKNTELLNNLIQGVRNNEKIVLSAEIRDKSGSVLAAAGALKDAPSRIYISSCPVLTQHIERTAKDRESEIFFFPDRSREPEKYDTIGNVILSISLEDMHQRLYGVIMKIVAITAGTVFAFIVIIVLLVSQITLPITALVEATEKLSSGDLEHRVDIASRDEIGKLAASFNRMTDELSRTLVSKDYVDNILESMIDALVVTDPDATITTVNQATLSLLGYAEAELRGQNISLLFADPEADREVLGKQLLAQGTLDNRETAYRARDGRQIPVILSASTLRGKDGTVQGLVYVALDITERKRSEERIRQSEERYRSLVETAPEIIYSLSIADGTILSLNPAFRKTTGWECDEWIGRSFRELLHPDDLPLAEAMIQRVSMGAVPPPYELRVRARSGEYLVGEFTSAPRYERDRIVAEFGVVRDITERKKVEKERETLSRQLLQSEKMAAVGQLAGGVAHEINNPLGVILGFSQSVIRRITENDQLFLPLSSIEREAKRCRNLVQDLLTFSRVGKTDRELCDLNEVIRGALTLVEAQSKVRSVELVREFADGLPMMYLSRNQVQQIVVNLCNNAMDAMGERGRLTVRTLAAKEAAEIQVEDTGCGIPKELQTKIFEPFFTTKEVGKGTGLGLSLVYEIVQKHRGTIELESTVGRGTTFRITLPLK